MVSTRRSQTESGTAPQSYNAGDKVEVVRSDGMTIGKLLYRTEPRRGRRTTTRSSPLSSSSSSSDKARWMISIDETSDDEQDIQETMLGRVLDSSTAAKAAESSDNGSTIMAVEIKRAFKPKTGSHKGPTTGPTNHRSSSLSRGEQHRTRARTRSSGDSSELLGGIEEVELPPPRKRVKHDMRLNTGETVVKVKMLTGTLYLYKGRQRRAEFVRSK